MIKILKISILLVISPLLNSFADQKIDFENPIHGYYHEETYDSFYEIRKKIDLGIIGSKRFSNDLSTLNYLLNEFGIPKSSQVLVFSNTSLQLSKINPKSPRALYFSDNLYLGYVAKGQLEVIGIDPQKGVIPYIFDLPKISHKDFPPIYRSRRCMKCHASEKTDFIPGLLLGSVIPMKGGGTLDVINFGKPGHDVPYKLRFGGWYIDHSNFFNSSWANSVGELVGSSIKQINLRPNTTTNNSTTDFSDPVAHLVLEHQVGFINLCLKIQYLFRESIHNKDENLLKNINLWVKELLDYTLFLNEPQLPNRFEIKFSPFAQQFQKINTSSGKKDILREFDLSDRLFRFRCSYLINGKVFSSLPLKIKDIFYEHLVRILKGRQEGFQHYSHLKADEKKSIDDFLLLTNLDYQKKRRL